MGCKGDLDAPTIVKNPYIGRRRPPTQEISRGRWDPIWMDFVKRAEHFPYKGCSDCVWCHIVWDLTRDPRVRDPMVGDPVVWVLGPV